MLQANYDIFIKNKAAIDKKCAGFFQIMQGTEDELKVEVIKAKDGNLSMMIINNEKTLYIHSKYKPVEEASKWAESILSNKCKVLIVFGIGLGYHIKELIDRLDKGAKLVVIEPSKNIFMNGISNLDYTEIINNSNFHFYIGEVSNKVESFLNEIISFDNMDEVSMVSLSNYENIFGNQHILLQKILQNIIVEKQLVKNTVLYFSKQWQVNLFKNLPYILDSHFVQDFANLFEGKPAIIVSAGPSLNKNVELLKKIKDKAVIICVDTALRILLSKGIKPDFVITVDGGKINYEHFDGIDYSDIPLVYDSRSYHSIIEEHAGEKILSLPSDGYLKMLFDRWKVDVGQLMGEHTVASNAFEFAIKIGADPVVFVGQDLCYADKEKTHAEGAAYVGDTLKYQSDIMIKDIYGNDVFTNGAFYGSLIWFNKRIEADMSKRVYIDATEGGARIDGTILMSLEEVIQRYCTKDITIEYKLKEIFNKENTITSKQIIDLIDEYKTIYRGLEALLSKCNQAADLCRELYDIYNNYNYHNNKRTRRILIELDNIDSYINKNKSKFELIDNILQPVMNSWKEQNQKWHGEEAEREKGIRIAQENLSLYEGIAEAIQFVEPLMDQCIYELEENYNIKVLQFTVCLAN